MHTTLRPLALASAAAALLLSGANRAAAQFIPGDLLVSTSTYPNPGPTITIGQPLPGGGNAVATGAYPGVFNNDVPDASFGLTSDIIINELTPTGATVKSLNITALTGGAVTTSFSSKSELALNLNVGSEANSAVTFMGYVSPVDQLDVSNSNTPGHIDSTNPVAAADQRAVIQLNSDGHVTYTPVDAYSGNNGRAAILYNGAYYMVGNAGNGSGTEPTDIVNNTGVQLATPGETNGATTVIGVQNGSPGHSKGFEYGFSVTSLGDTADKSGKDDNFRGETIFDNTLYVTKGSGSNGVDTVYQVGNAGSIPNASDASTTTITPLPGFPTTLASSSDADFQPFGLFFANASTLYVTNEGAGTATGDTGGLEKWSRVGGVWQYDYTLAAGLNLLTPYSVDGYAGPDPATDGLRNLTGEVNGNGTVTLFAVTSTISDLGDQGADPNELVAITDTLGDTTAGQAAGETFSVIDAAANGQVIRGVSFTPTVPEGGPSLPAIACLFGGLLAIAPCRRLWSARA